MPQNRIYLDHNAMTPMDNSVKELIPKWIEIFGNPSSIHWGGRGPKTILRDARKQFAQAIGCDPLEVIFTSGGSEANNFAIKGVFFSNFKGTPDFKGTPEGVPVNQSVPVPPERNHYLFSSVEHPSVTRAMEFLKRQGAEVEVFPVGPQGEVDLDLFKSKLRPTTALVSFMLANNETGVIFPIKKMVKLAHEAGSLFHADCVQALGKILFSVKHLGVDLASFSSHKFYSLKGSGALFARKGLTIEPLIHGGGQERHRRAGTENVLSIASLGHMSGKATEVASRYEHLKLLRDTFEKLALSEIPGVKVNSVRLDRLPNTSSLVIEGIEGETLLMNLDMEGFAVSTGAACSSGNPEPSPTLLAMGLTRREAQSSLRVSFGWENKLSDVEQFVTTLISVVKRQRDFQRTSIEEDGHASL